MNELANFLVEGIITENINDKVVVYSGRFQPFHKGHYLSYKHLVKTFGKDNVYIGTSDKTDKLKSPFSFKEKQMIITKLFDIPKDKIIQVKNPYAPKEVLKNYDPNTTAYITAVGEKDAKRLGGKYFKPYEDGKELEGYENRGYVYTAPKQANAISGTEVRHNLRTGSEENRVEFFKRVYPTFDKKIYKFITDRLKSLPEISEEVIYIPKQYIENWLVDNINMIQEISQATGVGNVDDGPNFAWPTVSAFNRISKNRAEQIGYTILSQIIDEKLVDIDPHPIYPNGPVKAVTPFPSGVIGKQTATNQKNFETLYAYEKWYEHVTRAAGLVGYSIVNSLAERDLKYITTSGLRDYGKQAREEEGSNIVSESIEYPKKSKGVSRKDMPQVASKDVRDYINYLKDAGISIKSKSVSISKLKLTQKDLNVDNIKVLMNNTKRNQLAKPTIISNDYYILDGHHRIVALYNLDKNYKLEVIIVDLPIDELLEITHKYSKSFSKDLNEMALNEFPMADLKKVDSYADKQFKPVDVVLTHRHFFDRLQDPRNKKPISQAELVGFFTRLAKNKDRFLEFLRDYGQIVAKDKRTNINIPFMKKANSIIAKTIMRKKDFKTSNLKYKFENRKEIITKENVVEYYKRICKEEGIKPIPIKFKKVGHQGAATVFNNTTKTPIHIEIDMNRVYDVETAILHELTHQIMLERHKDPFIGKRDKNRKFTKLENYFIEKYLYSDFSEILHMGKMNENLLNENREYLDSKQFLQEGGTWGHMNHPFETDINLTFGQLKDIVDKALEGELEFTREKTDGYAISVSWINGELKAARNKSHLKNYGERAMDIKGVAGKFKGRGELEKAYNFAMQDLQSAIGSLSDRQREKIFKNGSCFMNLEIIYPTSVNVIPYGQTLLIFHGIMEYDMDGNPIGENEEAARMLAGMVTQVNKNVQKTYTIQGPPITKIPKTKDLTKLKPGYKSKISKLQKEFGLKDSDGVTEYHKAWWGDYIDKTVPGRVEDDVKEGLVNRWALQDKSFRLNGKNIENERILDWAKNVDKQNHKKLWKENLMKFEDIFLGVGAEILSLMSSALTLNQDKATQQIKKRVDDTIKEIEKGGDPKHIEKLKLELRRLEAIGGVEKIVPIEGIVFSYKGHTMKLSGSFAAINQILSIMY